jgi:hypothetical protein
VDVAVLGTDVDDATGLVFSHPGITAELPPTPPEPPADPKKPAEKKKGRRGQPAPTEAKFKVSVAADVPPGAYDVRLVNKWGVSNPRLFVVGNLPEVNEKEPNNDIPEAQRVELNTVVNGVIGSPTDVDYVVFAGKKGQRVLAHCAATSLDSRATPLVEIFTGSDGRTRLAQNRQYRDGDALADVTLPADADYFVRVTEFAHQRGGPDHFYRLTLTTGPWVDTVFPPAVEPGKPAQVTLYGRNLPGGKPAPGMTVDGAAVQTLTVTVNPPADAAKLAFHGYLPPPMGLLDAFEYRFPGANAVPIFLTKQKVVLEKEAGNDRPESAEEIPVPCEVAGRIDRRFDRDWYAFTAKKGEVLMIELFADRIGANMDTYLTIRDAAKNLEIAGENQLDDDPNSLHPITFFSRSGDPPAYKFTAPADGKYLILVASRESGVSFGPRCVYRLRVAPPQPDFRAVVMPRSREQPAAVTAQADGDVAYDVFVDRHGGFAGPVTATAEHLPAGVTAKPAVIGTGQKWGTLVLTGADTLKDAAAPITVKATATIDGKAVSRDARPATISWGVPPQQNVPTLTRMDLSLVLATRAAKAPFRLSVDLAAAKVKGSDGKEQPAKAPFVLKPGDKLTVPVKVAWQEKEARPAPLQVQMESTGSDDPQRGRRGPVSVNNGQPVPVPKEKNEAPVTVDVRSDAPPGVYAVTFHGETQVKFTKDPDGKNKQDVAVAGFAAPFELTVVPTTLAKLTAAPPGNVKQGATAEVTVKVDRQFEFDGPFQVKLVFPKEAAGLSAADATIPAEQSEVKVKVTAAKDAKVGGVNNVLVQAVAMYDGKYATPHEVKINLNVVK